jgi:hypothetical protein
VSRRSRAYQYGWWRHRLVILGLQRSAGSSATDRKRLKFDNRYCWVCRLAGGKIVEVRAYLDSALVARLFEENPIIEAEKASGAST